MICAEQLSRSFASRRAVHRLNFELKPGSVVAFVGPNGAGKTTTLRMITGALAPSSGRVLVDGFDTFEAPYQARARIGFLPEAPPLYPELKVIENLRFVSAIKGLDKTAIDAVVEAGADPVVVMAIADREDPDAAGFRADHQVECLVTLSEIRAK